MITKGSLTLFIIKVIIFLCITKGTESICPSEPKCPNTTVLDDLNNEATYMPFQRDFIRQSWNSSVMPQLTPDAENLRNIILSVVDTDSHILLYALFKFSVWFTAYLGGLEGHPDFCASALAINSSIVYIKEGDGHAAADASIRLASLPYKLSTMITYSSLNAIKCKNVPPFETINTKCYKRGTVYEIDSSFELFGSFIPCKLKQAIYVLYQSGDYVDNLFANLFTLILSPLVQDLMFLHNQNLMIESLNYILQNSVSHCCCDYRKKRLIQLAKFHNTTVYKNSIFLINNKYLAPDC